jgi:lactoylglutathione lyase
MSVRRLSRRRALQLAGIAAIPSVVIGCEQSSPPTAPAGAHSSDVRQPESAAAEKRSAAAPQNESQRSDSSDTKEHGMELGAFSVSLAVKDLEASRTFYEKFGFKAFAGNPAQKWQILKNGSHVIGLFQGMFENNILTFNPGWDQNAQKLAKFTDVRDLQRRLKEQGVKLTTEADESTKGPASFTAVDPDGNTILIDQHV